MRHHRCRSRFATIVLAAVCGCLAGPAVASADEVGLTVLSNRADLVSGGDALVEVLPPPGANVDEVTVTADGQDVTDEFALRQDARFIGLVQGLRAGANELVARLADGRGARLVIRNHSLTGPVFAGPQVQPYICETEDFGLGEPTDAACSAPTRYDFFYKSTVTGTFLAYDPGNPPPDDLIEHTTTDDGNTVPYVVRRERGVIDRGIYDIAVLYDPDDGWRPWAPQPGWNGKLYYKFEGGCSPSHRQASTGNQVGIGGPGDVMIDMALARGFAVASSSLNRLHTNCNDVVGAEALMMVKEHFVERYGEIRYTIGDGCSGGSIQQHLIAANYPGLLDGIQPTCSFSDVWTGLVLEAADCSLLNRYFAHAPLDLWLDPESRRAVTGYASEAVCQQWDTLWEFDDVWLDPTVGCTTNSVERVGVVPEPDWVYDAMTNPHGVRCTLQDHAVAVFGRDPQTGFARRPLDNVGVQYGLAALRQGRISGEQFVDLNASIGGWDVDFGWAAARAEADRTALRIAYRSGRVTNGRQLAKVPIMDLRGSSNYDIHTDVHTHSLRARLGAANEGRVGNHVAWLTPSPLLPEQPVVEQALDTIDRWLAGIEGDTSGDPLELKVLRHKPADAVDTCFVAGEPGACGSGGLPYYASPRLVAGAPLANDVLKCRLRELEWSGYPVQFTARQKDRLRAAFPHGVCDYSRPGVEQQPPAGAWIGFADGPGGQPLPAPPNSTPLP